VECVGKADWSKIEESIAMGIDILRVGEFAVLTPRKVTKRLLLGSQPGVGMSPKLP
jgi:hypothetical protein